MGDFYKNSNGASVKVDGINVGVLNLEQDGNAVDSFPKISNNQLVQMKQYTWKKCDHPQSKERLKKSYEIV